MEKILSSLFGFLKYILLIVAFGLVFYELMITLGRLEKPVTDGIEFFIPFGLLLILFIVNLFVKSKKYISDNLLFNFVSCLVFISIIVICLRAKFDTGMILYHKYKINFNPAYFSDNLSIIKTMLYMLSGVNALLLVCHLIDVDDKRRVLDTSNVTRVDIALDDDVTKKSEVRKSDEDIKDDE